MQELRTHSGKLGSNEITASDASWYTIMSATPLLRKFFDLLNNQIKVNNGEALRNLLPIEPPFSEDYHSLLNEIFSRFKDEDSLKETIRSNINVVSQDDKDAWYAFPDYLQTYFSFIRTVNPNNLLETYEKLRSLLTCDYFLLTRQLSLTG